MNMFYCLGQDISTKEDPELLKSVTTLLPFLYVPERKLIIQGMMDSNGSIEEDNTLMFLHDDVEVCHTLMRLFESLDVATSEYPDTVYIHHPHFNPFLHHHQAGDYDSL